MGKVSKGVSRALAVNEGGTVSRALGGSQGVALAIGIVAAVAMPFALPVIATAIGSSLAVSSVVAYTIAGGLYGAATGALSGSMTGNAGRGAAIGGAAGAAGGFVQGGGLNALFGPAPTEAAAAGAQANYAPGAVSTEALAPIEGVAGGLELPLPPEFLTPEQAAALSASTEGATAAAAAAPATGVGSAAGGATTGGATTAAGGALPPKPEAATGSWWDRFGSGFAGSSKTPSITTAEGLGKAASGLVSPSGVLAAGQLAMTMFNKPPEGLTPQERAYVDETAALASTNRQQYDARVTAAQRLLARGTANPEQAFASASGGYQRRARSAGLRSPEEMRRSMLEGARAGAQAAAGEEGRAYQATLAGLSAMPGSAPAGPAAYALPAYRDVDQRQREYQANIGRSLGGLASAMGGRSSLYG